MVVIVKVVVCILKLDLRGEGFGNGGKLINNILVAVAYSLNKGKTDLAIGSNGREIKCGKRIVSNNISFYGDYKRFLWC